MEGIESIYAISSQGDNNNTVRLPPSEIKTKDYEQKGVSDIVMVDILSNLVKGNEEKAIELANEFFYGDKSTDTMGYSRYYVGLLSDIIKELKTFKIQPSFNYYDYEKKQDIEGVYGKKSDGLDDKIVVFVKDLAKELSKI